MKLFLTLNILLILALNCLAQGKPEDYQRSQNLFRKSYSLISKNDLKAHWSDDEKYLWYKVNSKIGEYSFYVIDLKTGKKALAFDSQKLTQAINKLDGTKLNAKNLPVSYIEFSDNYLTFKFLCKGKSYECKLPEYKITPAKLNSVSPEILSRKTPSSNGGTPTSIKIKNSTKEKIKIEWVDSKGERKPYGELAPGNEYISSSYAGHVWALIKGRSNTVKHLKLKQLPNYYEILDSDLNDSNSKTPRHISPDRKWQALTQNGNLFIKEISTGKNIQLSKDGTQTDYYTNSFYWSPDSKKLVCLKRKNVPEREISFVESSPKDQLQPKLHTIKYVKPGDPLPFIRPQLFNVELQIKLDVKEDLFNNPFNNRSYNWLPDSSVFTFVYNQRGHQALRVISIDANTGNVRAIVNEESKTFVHYSGKYFLKFLYDSNEVIWMSERDGWNHLYLYDLKSGKVKNQITKGNWPVSKVLDVDIQKREILFEATGVFPDQDPYHIHICRINFDGSGFTKLTSGDGTHDFELSPKGNYLLAKWSRVDLPLVNEIRRVNNGAKVCDLEKADWSELLKSGWTVTKRFKAKGRDGKTDIWGIIVFPSNFDKSKKYPVIEEIYAGPHDSHVPKAFNPLIRMHQMAEMGFISVRIDGMGTSNRSKEFHDYCWKNLADSGFPDRILWMKAASKVFPQMDVSKVGIYGGSAGGQNAMRALIDHGDFYKAAAADCGCHDNRMDKIWWNEQWMGWPVDKHYEESSNVAQAHKLKGKLLLTVGELDSNVDPASTMQVVNALIKADKDFELIVFPGRGHGSGWGKYGMKRIYKFFTRALYGIEPEF